MRRLLFLPSLAGWLGAASLTAAVVNIDFQVGAGRGVLSGASGAVLPSTGPVWNVNAANGVSHPLLTSSGAPSGYELVSWLYDAGMTTDADAMFGDYVWGDATITGLNPGQNYLLVIYGGANLQNIYRVVQPFDTASPGYGEVVCGYQHTVLPGVDGCNYVVGEVVADAFGRVTVEVRPGAMAGMQLAPNPEPSLPLFLAIAALVVGLRRRRAGS